MPKQIGNKILILGGGRWGQITYNNLFDEAFIEKLQIISKSLKLSKSILKDKNIKIQKKIDYNKIKNYNLISICKNNISKLRYLKKLYNFKNILVIEKPLIIKKKINRFLLSFSKRKFFLSLPWYFETKIKNNIV
jgi:ribosomal protein L24